MNSNKIVYLQATQKIGCVGYSHLIDFLEHYKIPYEEKSLKKLRNTKFSIETLEELKNTHILIPVFQTSVLNLASYTNCVLNFTNTEKKGLIKKEPFICDGHTTNWFFVGKNLLTNPTYPNKILPLRILLFSLLILDYIGKKKLGISTNEIVISNTANIKKVDGRFVISSYEGSETIAPEIY